MSSPAPEHRRAQRLPGLDGLRAIAVAMVIAYHFLPGFTPGGFIGVDVFFVISGFIITYLLLRERSRGVVRLGAFWLRRARRLLPALVVLVLACCTAALLVGGDVLVKLGSQVVGAFTFSINWIFIAGDQSYFAQSSPQLFRNLWSLAVEEQFYLVWPFVALLIITIRWTSLRVVAALAIAAASGLLMALLYVPHADPSRVYYGSDTHAFGLAIGAALAFVVHSRKPLDLHFGETVGQAFERRNAGWLGAVGFLAVLACAFVFTDSDPYVYEGGLVLVCLLTAVAIWSATRPRSSLGGLLDLPPLRWVGVRSYGLYLWHWPVFILLEAALPTWPRVGLPALGLAGIALAVTVLAATLSYRFIETPVRRDGFGVLLRPFRRGARRAPRLVAGLVAVGLVATGALATSAAVAVSPSETVAQRQIALGRQAIAKASLRAPSSPTAVPTPTAPPTPAPTATPSTTAAPAPTPTSTAGHLPPAPAYPVAPRDGSGITAIGDSVMLASAPALEAAFPGIAIDAQVSRQARDAPAIIQADAAQGTLRGTLVIGLGTNGYLGTGTLQAIRNAAGADRPIVFVNIYAARPWLDEVNDDLASFAADDPDTAVADWHDAIAGSLGLLGSDQIHPGGQGGQLYAACVAAALDKLGG